MFSYPSCSSSLAQVCSRGSYSILTAYVQKFQGSLHSKLGIDHCHFCDLPWPNKELTRPAQIQGMWEKTPPLDESCCKVWWPLLHFSTHPLDCSSVGVGLWPCCLDNTAQKPRTCYILVNPVFIRHFGLSYSRCGNSAFHINPLWNVTTNWETVASEKNYPSWNDGRGEG